MPLKPSYSYSRSVSDTPSNYFCALRRRRARPAHAHDAPFTRSHARNPGIDPPKRFHTRSNPTPCVARARQALGKTTEKHMRTKMGRRVFDRPKR